MPTLHIRPMHPDDVSVLSEYWYDRMALLQQSHPHIRLQRDARTQWEAAVRRWLHDEHSERWHCLSAETDNEVIGGIVGRIAANQPGLLPEKIGQIETLIVDLHTPHKQQGMGGQLLQALNARFQEAGITQVRATAPLNYAVEQAFWRGVGATRTDTLFWMTL